MPVKFLYFDLGNVLLHFDNQLACRQMSSVCNIAAERIHETVFAGGLKGRYETGEFSREAYHQLVCDQLGTTAELEALELAGAAIFQLNASMVAVIKGLEDARLRLGILSNVCESHWRYLTSPHLGAKNRFGIIPAAFQVLALSFRIGACKPTLSVYEAAAKLAGVEPQEIFYCDDLAENVTAAREAGFDAVQYTETPKLVRELRERGLRFNY